MDEVAREAAEEALRQARKVAEERRQALREDAWRTYNLFRERVEAALARIARSKEPSPRDVKEAALALEKAMGWSAKAFEGLEPEAQSHDLPPGMAEAWEAFLVLHGKDFGIG